MFYVTCLTRAESDKLLEQIVEEFPDDGLDWQAACLKVSDAPIGYTGLAHVNYELPITPCVEIGWLFLPEFWGNGYATEAARKILRHGFQHHELEEVVAFSVHNNLASIAVMEKTGMQKDVDADFDHPIVPNNFKHLNPQVLYRARRI
ncbi:MAG: GNAT family N-acetyltransferase [Granulosicoccus sp.]